MQKCVENGDTEAAHSEADDLLVAALLTLAEKSGDLEIVRQIVDAYESVDKWYA
jgi:hypothetical protein